MSMGLSTRRRSNRRILLAVLFVLGAGCLLAASPAAGESPGEGAINISVEPTETEYGPNDTVTYEVIVEGAEGGVYGYGHLDIVIEDPSVAQFVDFYETANDNDESNITFSTTRIENADGNESETGPVFSMDALLTGGTHFEPTDNTTFVVAEIEAEVLGEFTSASDVSIVKNPEPDPYDEPEVLDNLNPRNAYNVSTMEDTEVALRDEANVSLVPAETELQPGETTTYQVVVESAEYGVQSYDGLTVAITDPAVGQFVDIYEPAEDNVDPGGDPPVSNSEIRDAAGNPVEAGSVAYLDADLADGAFEGSSEVVVAELTAEATGFNTTDVTVSAGNTLRDLGGVDYEITDTTGSQLDPIGIDVTGDGKPATDTTGDGLLNNVDGDESFGIFDVQALFDNFEDQSVQDNVPLFDFSGDGNVNIFDVQSLFNEL